MKTINDSLRCLMKQQVNNELCDYLSGLLA
ncbi:Hypothetical protein Y17_3782 [Pectobacterium wasabiae CFBP 3304]|nr:Hypothetical protein Y17_3782 [Pectobacterium wasabiae CFBP 3304]